MVGLTQEGKFISIETSLGDDAFLLYSFQGQDHISQPFTFQLELLAEDPDISPTELIGKPIDIRIELSDGSDHYFNGHVESLQANAIHTNGYRQYTAEVVPWFTLLNYIDDCRIFQAKEVKAIVEEVFSSRGYTDFEFKLQKTYRTREYTVQYRESDFNFVSRLLEEEGIFYFHKHQQGKHTLVIADDAVDYETCTENSLRYFTAGKSGDHLNLWNHQYSLVSGKCSQDDYNFETPATDISVNVSTFLEITDADKLERYDYPGLYANRDEGNVRIKSRIEEQETQYETIESAGSYRSLVAGGKFQLELHEIESERDKEYVITGITFYAVENAYDPSTEGGRTYNNQFSCIPAALAYRPKRETTRPTIVGSQTAFVVGPDGEEIYTDEYGRIKVQFHWDRVGKKNENSSCWLRVGQQMAGKQWGAIFIPRIGHEVIVSFLEGDPDQPLVTGCVYNADNMPPYDLPANKTQSGWKTRSTTEGGAANYNEIRFEDKKGSESITIHAEKNFSGSAKSNYSFSAGNNGSFSTGADNSSSIGANNTLTVGANNTSTVSGNDTRLVAGNSMNTVDGNDIHLVSGNRSTAISGNQDISVGGDKSEQIGGNHLLNIGSNETVEVSSNEIRTVGANQTISVAANREIEVGANETTTVGADSETTAAGDYNVSANNIKLSANSSITLEVAGCSIKIEASGINITGTKITSAASAINEISGATVKIN